MDKFDLDLKSDGMKQLLQSQAVGDALHDIARDGATHARSIAPVSSGNYRDSIKSEQVSVPVGRESRAGAMIISELPYSAAVEGRHHVLSRTADYMNRK